MGIFKGHSTFKGGKVMPGKKHFSRDTEIESPPLPDTVTIPLWQHAGASAQVCVALGRRVKTGERIGKPAGAVSVAIHASISGTVTALEEISLPGGKKSKAVVIASDGRDECSFLTPLPNWKNSAPSTLLERIDEAGIVDLGIASFPAKTRLSPIPDKKVNVLLIDGFECEPYLTADYRLMIERAAETVTGIRIMLHILGISRAIIGIGQDSSPAMTALKKAIGNDTGISIHPLKVKYSQGEEKLLIKALLSSEVSSGGLPADAGTIVHHIGTAEAIYKAVVLGQPLIERVITISGEAISHQKNMLVRIGTPIGNLLNLCGPIKEKSVLIAGGPRMGIPLISTDIPVFKGLTGILALPRRLWPDHKEGACIKCGRCCSSCPLGLNPSELSEFGHNGFIREAVRLGVTNCCHCGRCTAICPAGRRNAETIKTLKEAAQQRKPA